VFRLLMLAPTKSAIIAPSVSILAEPPAALVDKVVDRKGTRKVAESYLRYLYSTKAQETIAKHYYRPRPPEVAAKNDSQFPKINLFTSEELFGGWQKAQGEHFSDGGIFDQIYTQ
jgi:sulfate transport system substrate-binding protein